MKSQNDAGAVVPGHPGRNAAAVASEVVAAVATAPVGLGGAYHH